MPIKPRVTRKKGKAWHWLAREGRLSTGDQVHVGGWVTFNGDAVICKSGLHASWRAVDAMKYAQGPWLCRVEVDDVADEQLDKLVAHRRRILWQVDATDALKLCVRDLAWAAIDYVDDLYLPVVAFFDTLDMDLVKAAGRALNLRDFHKERLNLERRQKVATDKLNKIKPVTQTYRWHHEQNAEDFESLDELATARLKIRSLREEMDRLRMQADLVAGLRLAVELFYELAHLDEAAEKRREQHRRARRWSSTHMEPAPTGHAWQFEDLRTVARSLSQAIMAYDGRGVVGYRGEQLREWKEDLLIERVLALPGAGEL